MADLAHAMWIHGTSMQIEYPERVDAVRRAGSGIVVEGKPGSRNWFHFAIPTPVIVDDNRLKVGSVLLVCHTLSADAVIRDLHVFDGGHRIAEHNNIGLSGDVGMVRYDVPEHPEVRTGIGISIGVGFGVEMMSHQMVFTSVGCDFLP
jgi:Family of unknown function (DUF6623)